MLDVEHAAEKYVKIVFAVNTQSGDAMTFQEFRSLVLIQPQIVSYLELIDVSEDEWASLLSLLLTLSITPLPDDLSDEQPETPSTFLLHLDELPPILAQHPYVQHAKQLPEKEQQLLGSFLEDMAIIVRERDQLKEDVRSSRSRGGD